MSHDGASISNIYKYTIHIRTSFRNVTLASLALVLDEGK
jgi:hypothetical protein